MGVIRAEPARVTDWAARSIGTAWRAFDLQLVVYAAGKVHRFTGRNLPIFEWAFLDDGTRVAYGQEPVHFGCETHYELRDIESERLIETVDIPQPCGLVSDPKPVRIPPWVAEVISNKPAP